MDCSEGVPFSKCNVNGTCECIEGNPGRKLDSCTGKLPIMHVIVKGSFGIVNLVINYPKTPERNYNIDINCLCPSKLKFIEHAESI